jgi:hypothetical protein
MSRKLSLTAMIFAGSLLLALTGCGGCVGSPPDESFNDLVNDINNQHPPLYDGTNNPYVPPGG